MLTKKIIYLLLNSYYAKFSTDILSGNYYALVWIPNWTETGKGGELTPISDIKNYTIFIEMKLILDRVNDCIIFTLIIN